MWIGRLTEPLGRKSDSPPGLKTVWQGYQQLCHAASVYELMTQKSGKAVGHAGRKPVFPSL